MLTVKKIYAFHSSYYILTNIKSSFFIYLYIHISNFYTGLFHTNSLKINLSKILHDILIILLKYIRNVGSVNRLFQRHWIVKNAISQKI